MELTDEELKQHIKNTEAMLLALRQERMARELKLAESLIPACAKKARQYFGLAASAKAETDDHGCQAVLVVELPPPLPAEIEERWEVEGAFYADPEVLEMCRLLFVHIRFV